jgi:hypothetical protein
VRSSDAHFVKASGLRWMSLMLLAPVPWAGRVWALPFLTALVPSERSCAERGLPAQDAARRRAAACHAGASLVAGPRPRARSATAASPRSCFLDALRGAASPPSRACASTRRSTSRLRRACRVRSAAPAQRGRGCPPCSRFSRTRAPPGRRSAWRAGTGRASARSRSPRPLPCGGTRACPWCRSAGS